MRQRYPTGSKKWRIRSRRRYGGWGRRTVRSRMADGGGEPSDRGDGAADGEGEPSDSGDGAADGGGEPSDSGDGAADGGGEPSDSGDGAADGGSEHVGRHSDSISTVPVEALRHHADLQAHGTTEETGSTTTNPTSLGPANAHGNNQLISKTRPQAKTTCPMVLERASSPAAYGGKQTGRQPRCPHLISDGHRWTHRGPESCCRRRAEIHGMEEVRGSNPLSSTKEHAGQRPVSQREPAFFVT
jgi:hypothetical protein